MLAVDEGMWLESALRRGGGSLDPCPEEQDKGPSGGVPDDRSQHDVEDFCSDDETDCIPGPSVEQSDWEVPPEEEFGMNDPEDLLAIQAQELPPEWATKNMLHKSTDMKADSKAIS